MQSSSSVWPGAYSYYADLINGRFHIVVTEPEVEPPLMAQLTVDLGDPAIVDSYLANGATRFEAWVSAQAAPSAGVS